MIEFSLNGKWNLILDKEKNGIKTDNNKLITASKYFGWDYTDYAHNALADVYATIYVLQKIIEDEEFYMEVLNVQRSYTPKKTSSSNTNSKPKTVKKTVTNNFNSTPKKELNLLDFEENDNEPFEEKKSIFADIEGFDEDNPF